MSEGHESPRQAAVGSSKDEMRYEFDRSALTSDAQTSSAEHLWQQPIFFTEYDMRSASASSEVRAPERERKRVSETESESEREGERERRK